MQKIGFMGAGNMGMALIEGLLKEGYPSDDFIVVEPSLERRNMLAAKDIQATETAQASLASVDILFLCVKPQQLQATIESIRDKITAQTIISIAAGIRVESIERWLGKTALIIRAMPNTPATLGLGMTGLFSSQPLESSLRQELERLFQGTGKTIWLEKEEDVDALTAISGSGPAYFFYLMESMINAAEKLGFSRETAQLLVKQTALGAASLAAQSVCDPNTLRANVTSKGGTTEAAINQFDAQQVNDHLVEGIFAAYRRSMALAKNT